MTDKHRRAIHSHSNRPCVFAYDAHVCDHWRNISLRVNDFSSDSKKCRRLAQSPFLRTHHFQRRGPATTNTPPFSYLCHPECRVTNGVTPHRVAPTVYKPLSPSPNLFTLTHQAECSRYFGQGLLRPAAYAGSVSTRRRLAAQLGLTAGNVEGSAGSASGSAGGGQARKAFPPESGAGSGEEYAGTEPVAVEYANVIVTSYNVLRTDASVLGGQVREGPADSCASSRPLNLVVHMYVRTRSKENRKTGRHVLRFVSGHMLCKYVRVGMLLSSTRVLEGLALSGSS